MNVLIINQSEVRRLLPMDECMTAMAGALSALTRGEAVVPLRMITWLPERVGALGLMPSYHTGINAMGVKVVSVFPKNHGTEFDSHQGAVLLFEATHGQLLAVVDASSITAIRTAAVSGVATRLLARSDADSLAILGTGVQAATHLAAMLEARAITSVRVWSRTFKNAEQFAQRESRRHNITIEAVDNVERHAHHLHDHRCRRANPARRMDQPGHTRERRWIERVLHPRARYCGRGACAIVRGSARVDRQRGG